PGAANLALLITASAAGLGMAPGLEQKPNSSLSLVDPILQKARAGDVSMLFAQRVGLAHSQHNLTVVFAEFSEHVARRDEIRVIVGDALKTGDMADRAQGRAADFSHAFGHRVGGGEDLLRLFIEQQVKVAKVRSRYMPMEVLGLQVKSEYVCEQYVQSAGNVGRRVSGQARRSRNRRLAPGFQIAGVHRLRTSVVEAPLLGLDCRGP